MAFFGWVGTPIKHYILYRSDTLGCLAASLEIQDILEVALTHVVHQAENLELDGLPFGGKLEFQRQIISCHVCFTHSVDQPFVKSCELDVAAE